MASAYLANLALGFVKAKNAQAKEAMDRAYAEEQQKKQMDLEVEQKKRLDALAFDALMQKTVVQKGFNQQANARIAEQYGKIAATSTDPVVRKHAKKWQSVYAGAGDLDAETAESIGKNLTPEKAAQMSVQDYEAARKRRNEEFFTKKLTEMADMDMAALEADPKARQKAFIQLARGLDSDYVENLKEHFDAFFPKIELKDPQQINNARIQYSQRYREYMALRKKVEEGSMEPDESVQQMELSINELADTINAYDKTKGRNPSAVRFEDDDANPETLSKSISPEKQTLMEQTEGIPGGGREVAVSSPGPTASLGARPVLVDKKTRYTQLKQQFPEKTVPELAKILNEEKGQTWQ
jgi:hypothetical protein